MTTGEFEYRGSHTADFVRELHRFFNDAVDETLSARGKFPIHGDDCDNPSIAAMMEEVGELAKAMMQEDTGRVREEALQVAAMAARCALEGDPTLDLVRAARVAQGPTAPSMSPGESNNPVEVQRAWQLYAYEADGGFDVYANQNGLTKKVPSWDDLPIEVKEHYILLVRQGHRVPAQPMLEDDDDDS